MKINLLTTQDTLRQAVQRDPWVVSFPAGNCHVEIIIDENKKEVVTLDYVVKVYMATQEFYSDMEEIVSDE